MGANVSCSSNHTDGEGGPSLKSRLGDITEGCVALVLMHLEPLEICKLARLNRAFRRASSADFIWDSKLPQNYHYMMGKVFDKEPVMDMGKKDLYARLCRPNPFDGSTKEVWLDKTTGGVCLSISSRALTITGIDDKRYWNHISTEDSRFQTVAYLQQIWWLEVDGELEFQFPAGTYSLYFRLQLGRSYKRLGRKASNIEQVHGWDTKPVQFQLTTSNGQHAVSQCFLDNPGNWVHYPVGDFVVERPNELTRIKFSLTQIDCTHTKGGLCVDAVFIYPNGVGHNSESSKI